MKRPSLRQLETSCQKPDHRRVGNFYARRVARPLALRVTWGVLPWGISAHAMTLTAWLAAMAAAAAFAQGTIAGWLLGAGLLQVWYLLDHVDGQLARARGAASLDGVQLDYLMHHTVNVVLPLGMGLGLFARRLEPLWLLVGVCWSIAALLLALRHDAMYKAFFQRFKRLEGELLIRGGGGARPAPPPGPPRGAFRFCAWMARKLTEMHVVMNLLAVVAIAQWTFADAALRLGAAYFGAMALLAMLVAVATVARSVTRHDAEREFAAWCRPPEGHDLVFENGWWKCIEREDAQAAHLATADSAQRSGRLDP